MDRSLAARRSLPDVRAELEGPGAPELDAQLALHVAGKPIHALVELKKAVYPRDVRQLVWRIRDLARQQLAGESGGEPLAVLVAESISPGAKELLRAERVGYYDSGGSLYLPARGAYLYVDRPPPKSLSRSMRSLFTGRRAQVLHGLLVRHQDWFGVKDLAEQALVSPATASQVLTEMERFDWLESRGQGPSKQRHLREPAALLDTWAKQLSSIRPPALRRYFVPAMKPDGLMETDTMDLGPGQARQPVGRFELKAFAQLHLHEAWGFHLSLQGLLFPIGPGDQVAQGGAAVVTPGQRRLLHPAQGADAGGAPARERGRQRRHPGGGRRQEAGFEHRARHGLAEQEALHFVADLIFKKFRLFPGFHAFGDDGDSQIAPQAHNGIDHGHIDVALLLAGDEGAVDFEAIELELLQIGQRRIARAEIIQRDSYAEDAQIIQNIAGDIRIREQHAFSDFKNQSLR